jgi:hypothetical protein
MGIDQGQVVPLTMPARDPVTTGRAERRTTDHEMDQPPLS